MENHGKMGFLNACGLFLSATLSTPGILLLFICDISNCNFQGVRKCRWDLETCVSRVMVVNEPAWMLSSAWRRRVICWSPCMRNVGLTFFLTLTYYFAHWKSPVWTGLLNICILFPELLQSSRVAYLGKCITSHTPLPHFLEERKATKWQAGSKLSYWAKNCMWINRWKGGKVPFCLTSYWADFEDIKTSR